MSAITVKGIPEDLMERLRALAEEERRSMNQQVICLMEEALQARRPSFTERYEAFLKKHGPSPLREEDFEGLRSHDTGRPSPFEDFEEG